MAEPSADPDHDAEDRDPVGLECLACGCRDWRVWKTRKYLNVIVRERRCRHCGKPTFTREVVKLRQGD